MDLTVVDESLAGLLAQRGLFLMPERSAAADDVVYVCVDDGFPGGFPVGRVIRSVGPGIPSDAGTWSAYARVRPGHRVSAGLLSLEEAVRAVIEHARYGDVTSALEQLEQEAVSAVARLRGEEPGHVRRGPLLPAEAHQ
ncbi:MULTISPECIES: hypothetical protein [Streptomyces]|uniref:Uncharacterized protein n=1 Tax=Streptomyces dengpaensis TaxID=2049881 RepID=A0ABM6SWG0_9ACTN|nr:MULTISPECIES: hypothetical protein [Streptomyces]AVH58681.1 hypothetical protein C4B68_26210 [Streptomyces dengpaensis]PIB11257.1 hypothetical protein B1C81_05425 [Streptomyces sp. HG99]